MNMSRNNIWRVEQQNHFNFSIQSKTVNISASSQNIMKKSVITYDQFATYLCMVSHLWCVQEQDRWFTSARQSLWRQVSQVHFFPIRQPNYVAPKTYLPRPSSSWLASQPVTSSPVTNLWLAGSGTNAAIVSMSKYAELNLFALFLLDRRLMILLASSRLSSGLMPKSRALLLVTTKSIVMKKIHSFILLWWCKRENVYNISHHCVIRFSKTTSHLGKYRMNISHPLVVLCYTVHSFIQCKTGHYVGEIVSQQNLDLLHLTPSNSWRIQLILEASSLPVAITPPLAVHSSKLPLHNDEFWIPWWKKGIQIQYSVCVNR